MSVLIQWMWQGVALAVVVWVCLSGARRVSASMRYRVWWATLALLIALPFLSVLELPGLGAVLGVAGSAAPLMLQAAERAPDIATSLAWLPLVALGTWVMWSGARLYAALAYLDAAKRACRPFPIVRERQLPRWKAARNRGRRATLVVSEHVHSAGVLGLGYPRIAVAPRLLSSLTDEELDLLVLHEYAHVQRRDDVATAVQLVVRVVIGWHPAAWWIDRRLRIEREVACDDWVLAATGAPRTYARCLTRIADLAMGSESLLMPAASCQPQLTTRVVRLLDGRRNTSIRPSAVALAAATMMLAVVSIGLTGSHTTVIALPAVARASFAPGVHTPELTFARLVQALSEPTDRRTARPARDKGAPIDARVEEAQTVNTDAVRAVALLPPAGGQNATDAVAASMDHAPEAHAIPRVDAAHLPSASTAAASSATTAGVAIAEPPGDSEESGSWVESTGRALAGAGKATGQSIADAGVDAGLAVADASVATFRGGQKTVVKAGRFFSRLGRALAKPF